MTARLGALAKSAGSDYDGMMTVAFGQMGIFMNESGHMTDLRQTSEVLSKMLPVMIQCGAALDKAALVAPDHARRHSAIMFAAFCYGSNALLWHRLQEFDKDIVGGPSGSKLRTIIQDYHFESMHAFNKSSIMGMDLFLGGSSELCMLLWWGDAKGQNAKI